MSHAIVIGGGIAGILAARVLRNHFSQVTLIERDSILDKPYPRKGTPQSTHVHVLLMRGHRILEALFPGFTHDLVSEGALVLDLISDWWFIYTDGPTIQKPSGLLKGLTCSRQLIEWYLRSRLCRFPEINLLPETIVTGLVADSTKTRIIGLEVRSNQKCKTVNADLVVDASGRSSRLPEWLSTLGCPSPKETVVNPFLGYSSRWYERRSTGNHKGVVVLPASGISRRGGIIYPVENNHIIITLIGTEKDYPPKGEAAFLDFARSIRDPSLAQAIELHHPVSTIQVYRGNINRWRHYEKLKSMPKNLIVLGDAVCVFNPVYGQGMTVAALGAQALDKYLERSHYQNFSLGFQQCLARQLTFPWLVTTSEDFRWAMTTGERPGFTRQKLQRFFDRVTQVAQKDPQINRVALEIGHLVKSPVYLITPSILWKVFLTLLKVKV